MLEDWFIESFNFSTNNGLKFIEINNQVTLIFKNGHLLNKFTYQEEGDEDNL